MNSILDIIKPIKLLAGNHADTGKTGQGCAMNVIAYLKGEKQITDRSPCVCLTIRAPIIWFNDFLLNDERQELIPLMLRAMGSATSDESVIKRRLELLVKFANGMANAANAAYAAYAAANAANAAANAAYAAANAAYAAANAAANAAYAATNAAYAAANAANASKAAANAAYAAANAAYAAAYAAANAANASKADREKIKKIAFNFFGDALPKEQQYSDDILRRAQSLVEIARAA